MAKRWMDEEIYYLQDYWGSRSIKAIAKQLDRSVEAVRLKAGRIGLRDARFNSDVITINQLSKVLGVWHSTLIRWSKMHDLPVRKKIFAEKESVYVIGSKAFWKWAEQHKQILDFSKIEPLILGPEPKWAEVKRKADQLKSQRIKRSINYPWTPMQDYKLKELLAQYRYTYPEIALRLKRSEGAVKRRLLDLGLKARPVRLNNHIKYSAEEIKLIKTMYDRGYCFEEIAARINKSALGVRGKMERMGYKFKHGVPIQSTQ